ncbi:hypothetical protein PVAP13_4NG286500 [Panicum virgatum]|uniref:Uncharacterized protein n=1 Tax=Panicum virgatum TaxID=38727 RepID=A0A8T0TCY9_PANVG|nr:hypothetical protein PVAP13_4NG286500 [Panicum virgatum]
MSQVNIEGHGCGRPLPPQPTVKVYCRANPNYAMTIRNGKVVLAPANPKDDYQHWIKDMRWSTSIKDEEGYPAGLRAGEQGHRGGHQALAGAVPPGAPGALQPRLPGRVRALDGEPRRRQRLPLHPHGQQHLPQLRRPPRRQVARRRPRRNRDRALEVVRGRQPALEDPAILLMMIHKLLADSIRSSSYRSAAASPSIDVRPFPAAAIA